MSIRKDIAYFHNSDNTGMCPEDNGRLCGVLDFTEEVIAALSADGHRSGGYAAHEANHSRPCACCAALGKLDEESR